jgi:putative flippase GtrA
MTSSDARSFLRFVAVGAVNTGIGLATVIAASQVPGVNAYVANGAGLAAGFIVGFQLNRRWTFRSLRSVAMTAPRYLLVFLVSYAINLGVLAVALESAAIHPIIAQAAALTAYSLVFYFLCRMVVFPAGE